MVLRPGELLTEERRDALSIAELYGEVELALARTFPRTRDLWVRGEIQHVADGSGRSGHCYLDLVDPDSAGNRQAPVLKVKCWQKTWGPIRLVLRRAGITLVPGMVVLLRGTLDFYRPKAEIGFVLQELDVTALLGRMAAQRAALLQALRAEGLLERNRSLPVPPVPLRVGLVASPGSEGYRDFLGQLTASGLAFCVRVARSVVQGPDAPRAIATALNRLSSLGPEMLDVVVVVRGGGSKGDLAAFDAERVARAIAGCPVPVWTGIGHTGDESVADIVANRSCITPTECGRDLAQMVRSYWEQRVAGPAVTLGRRSAGVAGEVAAAHATARRRLLAMAGHHVARQAEHLARTADSVGRGAPRALAESRAALGRRGSRIGPLAAAQTDRAEERLLGCRRLVAAYDVERQLERGYTLTLDTAGRVLRSASQVTEGSELTTRFADGSARSRVGSVERHAEAGG